MTHPTTTLLNRQKLARRSAARCQKHSAARCQKHSAFTLVEMTIVIMIIAILAALSLPVINAAAQQAKVHRTRAIVAKLDQIIGEKWEAYRTRQVPIRVSGMQPNLAAGRRLLAMHELMRFEMPDRVSDVANGPAYGTIIPSASYPVIPLAALSSRPAVNKQFLRYTLQAHPPGPPASWAGMGIEYWSTANENAECLYLILAVSRDGDKSALDWFSPTEIGDTDDDGMKEILDAWGQPIAFLRWAPAYRSDISPFPVTPQRRNDTGNAADPTTYPDPFDPFKIDVRWTDGIFTNDPIALKPLIVSGGPNRKVAVNVNTPILPSTNPAPTPYALSTPPNDPYFSDSNGNPVVGFPFNEDATDNITNHDLEAK